jgi:hypothetical protein
MYAMHKVLLKRLKNRNLLIASSNKQVSVFERNSKVSFADAIFEKRYSATRL